MVAVHFEEQCAIDDDYGKKRPIRLFPAEQVAIDWLTSVGYKKDENSDKYRFCQYHSEMQAVIYNVVGDPDDV